MTWGQMGLSCPILGAAWYQMRIGEPRRKAKILTSSMTQ
jgi:hypothetical protein